MRLSRAFTRCSWGRLDSSAASLLGCCGLVINLRPVPLPAVICDVASRNAPEFRPSARGARLVELSSFFEGSGGWQTRKTNDGRWGRSSLASASSAKGVGDY